MSIVNNLKIIIYLLNLLVQVIFICFMFFLKEQLPPEVPNMIFEIFIKKLTEK